MTTLGLLRSCYAEQFLISFTSCAKALIVIEERDFGSAVRYQPLRRWKLMGWLVTTTFENSFSCSSMQGTKPEAYSFRFFASKLCPLWRNYYIFSHRHIRTGNFILYICVPCRPEHRTNWIWSEKKQECHLHMDVFYIYWLGYSDGYRLWIYCIYITYL
jgi:hypothetical protein